MKNTKAFTLIEVFLTTVLLIVFMLGIVFSFSTMSRNGKLIESVYQIEGMMRFSRAQSEYLGKKVKLTFVKNVVNKITFESEPLQQPNVYVNLQEGFHDLQNYDDYVQIVDTNNSTNDIMSSITFFPDGSCESTKLIITSNEDTNNQVVINVDGVIGGISHQYVSSNTNDVNEIDEVDK